jgi:arylsulfatase
MLTGRLPYRTGLIRPILAGDELALNPWTNESCIAQVLSDAGYYTVLTGKWHTGEGEGMRPWEVGFDEFQGHYCSQQGCIIQLDAGEYPDLVLNSRLAANYRVVSLKTDMYYGSKESGKEEVIAATVSIPQFAQADQILAQFTIDKIHELAPLDAPFFIFHNFMRVHEDNHPSVEFLGASASKYPYKDAVVEVDDIVGRILATLEDTGIAENTFVFFTSDNGPQRDSWPDSGYTPFRGGKSTSWEGGVRVPGIAYWKGVIQPRVSAGLFDLSDLYRTAVHLAGADDALPEFYVDSIDQTSFLIANNGQSKREHVYVYCEESFMAIRIREYKLHMHAINAVSTFMAIDYSARQDVGLAPWLFNLFIDPKEELPVGHRMNAWVATMAAEAKLHAETFIEFPPKDIGLGQPE